MARGYSDEYFAQFVTKLDKGTILDEKSRQAKKNDVSSSTFSPLGTSSTEVITYICGRKKKHCNLSFVYFPSFSFLRGLNFTSR